MDKLSYAYSSTQIDLPPGLSDKIRAWGKSNVPASAVYVDPKDPAYGRESDPHITVKYGLETDNPEDVSRITRGHGPVKLRLGKMSYFESKDYDVLKIDVDSQDLHGLNRRIKENLPNKETHPSYKPHVTIAYIKKGKKPDVDLGAFEGQELTVNELTFSGKRNGKMPISLGAKKMATITELLSRDIDAAVNEKLASYSRKKKRSVKRKIDLGDVALGASSFAASKVYNSILDDVGTKSVDSIKTRLYNMAESLARRFFRSAV